MANNSSGRKSKPAGSSSIASSSSSGDSSSSSSDDSSGDSSGSSREASYRLDLARMREETFEGLWADLQPHAERDALILVANDLDLAEVALAIAADDKESVGTWIQSGEVTRPTAFQLQSWSISSAHMFRFVIVAPYVVIQDLAN